MATTPTSKQDLLATAEAMLAIDNQERQLRDQHKREARTMNTTFLVALFLIALAVLFIAIHRTPPSHDIPSNQPASSAAPAPADQPANDLR